MPLTPFPRLTSWQDGAHVLIGEVWSQWINALRTAVGITPGNSQPLIVAELPVPVPGMIFVVTDATTNVWGATVVGGGALTVAAFYNGTHWTVIGK